MSSFFSNPKARALFWQVLLIGLLAVGFWLLVGNLQANLSKRGIEMGFGFLSEPAGFDIAERAIEYSEIGRAHV